MKTLIPFFNIRFYTILFMMSLFMIACELRVDKPLSPDEKVEPDGIEDRGVHITVDSYIADNHTSLLWSPDGSEIFYDAFGMIKSIDPITEITKVIDTRITSSPYDVTLLNYSIDSSSFYYVSLDGSQKNYVLNKASVSLRSHSIDYANFPVSKPPYTYVTQFLDPFLIRGNWGFGDDSMIVLNINTKTLSRYKKGFPVYLSQDGSVFVYGDPTYSNLYLTNLLTQDSTRLISTNSGLFFGNAFKYTSNGLYCVYASSEKTSLQNFTTNEIKQLWTLGGEYHYPVYNRPYWSPDGSRFAVACYNTQNVFSCPYNFVIYEYIVATGVRNQITYIKNIKNDKNETNMGAIAFSPDNSKIAYVLDQSLYYKKIH